MFVVNKFDGDYEFVKSMVICHTQADAEEMALAFHQEDVYFDFCDRANIYGIESALRCADCYDYYEIEKVNII